MRQYGICSFSGEPTFSSQREAEAHAQKLADENDCSVWYETATGEAECVPRKYAKRPDKTITERSYPL